MIQKSGGLVRLKDLTASHELRRLRSLHLANPAAPVRELALVSHFEELVSVGPDTIVLLSPGVARGGWMISAALRYAWERKACALIVPEQAFTETVIELAHRLDISLLSSESEMRRLAIDIAIQIGVARAGSLARLQAFAGSLSHANDLNEALSLTSEELGGARVSLESLGTTILHAESVPTHNQAQFSAITLDRISASMTPGIPPIDSTELLVAQVAPGARLLAEEVVSAAIPAVRALLAETRLRVTRDSLPLLSAAALLSRPNTHGFSGPALAEVSHLSDTSFTWPVSGRYSAVFFASPPSEHLGSLILQAWHNAVPSASLARLTDGWFGIVPFAAGDATEPSSLAARLRDAVRSGGSAGIGIGVSRVHEMPSDASGAIREAWFAARIAEPRAGSDQVLVEFDGITTELVPSVLPPEFAVQLAERLFPHLLAEQSGPELARSIVAYLDHHGSITAAADALHVHRNTLQTRLRRAEELGVQLSEPSEVLAIHLLMKSLLCSSLWA